MKIIIVLFTAFFIQNLSAQDSTYLSPSLYYTYGSYYNAEGSYDKPAGSNSLAFYNTLEITKQFYLINHYENLNITTRYWDYLQQTFLASGYFNYFPLLFSLCYSHYKGDYESNPDTFTYSDFTNLYNVNTLYYLDDYYLGIAYTHLNQIGYKAQVVNQLTLRLEKILDYSWFISIKPGFSKLSDGRELYSLSAKLHYLPLPEMLLKAGGFIGERAYYFDPDLYTIFNQDETQQYQVFMQAEYNFTSSIKMISSFQNTSFKTFSINYFTIGIKSSLFL